jgi:hypothetical protein
LSPIDILSISAKLSGEEITFRVEGLRTRMHILLENNILEYKLQGIPQKQTRNQREVST